MTSKRRVALISLIFIIKCFKRRLFINNERAGLACSKLLLVTYVHNKGRTINTQHCTYAGYVIVVRSILGLLGGMPQSNKYRFR